MLILSYMSVGNTLTATHFIAVNTGINKLTKKKKYKTQTTNITQVFLSLYSF